MAGRIATAQPAVQCRFMTALGGEGAGTPCDREPLPTLLGISQPSGGLARVMKIRGSLRLAGCEFRRDARLPEIYRIEENFRNGESRRLPRWEGAKRHSWSPTRCGWPGSHYSHLCCRLR